MRNCLLLNSLVLVLGILIGNNKSSAQTTNVARRQRSWDFPKSEESRRWSRSYRAVDGCKDTYFPNRCCSSTADQTNLNSTNPDAWWSVDLKTVYNISAVSLTNRGDCCEGGLRNFTIYGSFSSHDPDDAQDLIVCSGSVYAIASGATETFPCPEGFQARFIIIKKTITDNPEDMMLTLCEVDVLAECNDGWYGDHCRQKCSSHCLNDEPCDKVNGTCPGELCESGYSGPTCHRACKDGWYGDHCTKKCLGYCANDLPCDKVTGACPDQLCEQGYTGSMCQETLDSSKQQSSNLIPDENNTHPTSNVGLTLIMCLLLILITVFMMAYIYLNHKKYNIFHLLNGKEGSISYKSAPACKKEETFNNILAYDNNQTAFFNTY